MLCLIHGTILILTKSSLLLLAHVLEGAEEVRCTSVEVLGFGKLVEAESAAEQVGCLRHQVHTFPYVIDEAHVSFIISLVHVGKLERGTRMTAIEDGKQRAVGGHARDEMLMKSVRVNLTPLLKVNWANCVQDSRWFLACWITDLSAVTRVVEEIACPRLTHKPVNGSLVLG